MQPPQFRSLPDLLVPLADKFYRAHRSPMRCNQADHVWIAQTDEIIAGLCLRAVADGFWLTSLLVTPALRNKGIASQLINTALCPIDAPIWLFCDPQLAEFYARLGFIPAAHLPSVLDERLTRYQRTKSLIALRRN